MMPKGKKKTRQKSMLKTALIVGLISSVVLPVVGKLHFFGLLAHDAAMNPPPLPMQILGFFAVGALAGFAVELLISCFSGKAK